MMRDMTKDEVLARWPEPKASPDYAEILRIWRKYSTHEKEPLHAVFVRIGQQLEKAKPDRCKSCFRTALEYSRLVEPNCDDPFHAENTAVPAVPVME